MLQAFRSSSPCEEPLVRKLPAAYCPLRTARSPVPSSTPSLVDSKPHHSPRFSSSTPRPAASWCQTNKISAPDYPSAASTLSRLRRGKTRRTSVHLHCRRAPSTPPSGSPSVQWLAAALRIL